MAMKPAKCSAMMLSTAREDLVASEFPMGSEVRALDGALMRKDEARDSPKIREFPPNTVFTVTGYGIGDPKRMKVKDTLTAIEGWISCANGLGRAIVVPAHMMDAESPLDAVSRLRGEMGFGPKICILGGVSFQDPQSEELTKVLAQRISAWSMPDSVIITGGMSGVQKVFAQNCVPGTRLFNLLPEDGVSNYGCGKDIFGGQDIEERRKIFGLIGDCYITIEGGASVAKEARDAFERNVPVIAMRRTGGASGGGHGFPMEALEAPVFAKAAEWDMLGNKDVPVEQSADAALAIVNRSMQRVRADVLRQATMQITASDVVHSGNEEANPNMALSRGDSDDLERRLLIKNVFLILDDDHKQRLGHKKLRKFAERRGFHGDADDWTVEYGELCKDFNWDARAGIDLAQFASFVNSAKDFTTDDELKRIATALTVGEVAGAQGGVRPWLARQKTKEAMEGKPRDHVLPEMFRLLDPSGSGSVNQASMRRFARAAGFEGSDEDFTKAYEGMCRSMGFDARSGLKQDQLESLCSSHSGCGYMTDEDLRRTAKLLRAKSISDADASLAASEGGVRQPPKWLRPGAFAEKTVMDDKPKVYLVDNSTLQSKMPGLGYRLSRKMDDLHPTKDAVWNEPVEGINFGDGWLGIDCKEEGRMLYLPFVIRDCRVLTLKAAGVEKPKGPEPTYPGFELGLWDYVAVDKGASVLADPQDRALKRLAVLPAGEAAKIVERGSLQGVTWLRLADGRGWVAEKAKAREMSEVHFEPVDEHLRGKDGRFVALDPRMGAPMQIYRSPAEGEKAKAGLLHGGAIVEVKSQVRVLTPIPGKSGETWRVWVHVYHSPEVQGWIPMQEAGKDSFLVPCERRGGFGMASGFGIGGTTTSYSPASGGTWAIIEEKKVPVYPYPGFSTKPDSTVHRDDFLEIAETLSMAGFTFHRLAKGGWINSRSEKNKMTCELVTREQHRFIYLVKEKDGIDTKEIPSREKVKHLHMVRKNQKILVTERVTYKGGDTFVLVDSPWDGWVALTSLTGSERMKALGPAGPVGTPLPPGVHVPLNARPDAVHVPMGISRYAMPVAAPQVSMYVTPAPAASVMAPMVMVGGMAQGYPQQGHGGGVGYGPNYKDFGLYRC